VEVAFEASDFDFDGDVDVDDLQIWFPNFGTEGYLDADADFDYDADGADFLAWQRQFGASSSALVASPDAITAPEPTAAGLLGTACGAVIAFSRRCWPKRRRIHALGSIPPAPSMRRGLGGCAPISGLRWRTAHGKSWPANVVLEFTPHGF
jgi:hypothetical protein